jgi:aminobenzoyl-glutamate utilization protein B
MKAFANEMLAALGREPVAEPFDETVTPLDERVSAEFAGGADDVTEFCWHAPTARVYVAYGLRWPKLPNWTGAALAPTPAAHATVLAAARALAYAAVDLVGRPDVLERARAAWRERTAAAPIGPLLEPGAKPPELHFPPAASLAVG